VSQASIVHEPSFIAFDPEFEAVVGGAGWIAQVCAVDAHEGPVYAADEHALYFTTVPRPGRSAPVADIKRLDLESNEVTVLRADARMANGMTLDAAGMLVICEQGTRALPAAIALVDRASGERNELVTGPDGRALNSPNDVVVASDGTLWFTDPSYGWLQGFRPRPQRSDALYRFHPGSGELAPGADSFDKPNGVCVSPGEETLYVTDSGANHVKAFDLFGDGSLTGERVLAGISPGSPDGIKTDSAGRLYVSSASGVKVLSSSGDLLGEIGLPGAVNFCFGGAERDVLFVTADTAVYAVHLEAKGS
jgi:gluconolactonase